MGPSTAISAISDWARRYIPARWFHTLDVTSLVNIPRWLACMEDERGPMALCSFEARQSRIYMRRSESYKSRGVEDHLSESNYVCVPGRHSRWPPPSSSGWLSKCSRTLTSISRYPCKVALLRRRAMARRRLKTSARLQLNLVSKTHRSAQETTSCTTSGLLDFRSTLSPSRASIPVCTYTSTQMTGSIWESRITWSVSLQQWTRKLTHYHHHPVDVAFSEGQQVYDLHISVR